MDRKQSCLLRVCISLFSIVTAKYMKLGSLKKKDTYLAHRFGSIWPGEGLLGSHFMVGNTMAGVHIRRGLLWGDRKPGAARQPGADGLCRATPPMT